MTLPADLSEVPTQTIIAELHQVYRAALIELVQFIDAELSSAAAEEIRVAALSDPPRQLLTNALVWITTELDPDPSPYWADYFAEPNHMAVACRLQVAHILAGKSREPIRGDA